MPERQIAPSSSFNSPLDEGIGARDAIKDEPDRTAATQTSALAQRLRSPEALREAWLLKEILGPPVGRSGGVDERLLF